MKQNKSFFGEVFIIIVLKRKKVKNKFTHISLAAAEFLPVISQIVSFAEYFLKSHKNASSRKLNNSFNKNQKPVDNKITKKKKVVLDKNPSPPDGKGILPKSTKKIAKTVPSVSPKKSKRAKPSKPHNKAAKSNIKPIQLNKKRSKAKAPSQEGSYSTSSSTTVALKPPSLVVLGTKKPSSHELQGVYLINSVFYNKKSSDYREYAKSLLRPIKKNDIPALKKLNLTAWQANQRIDGSSLLEWAAHYGHLDAVRYLVKLGALDVLVTYNADRVHDINFPEKSALLVASLKGHVDIVKYLLKKGARQHRLMSTTKVTSFQNPYLPLIIERGKKRGKLKIVKLLVSYNNAPPHSLKDAYKTALDCGNQEISDFLLSQGPLDTTD